MEKTLDSQKDATRATLAFRVQSPADENRMYVVLAEYGQFFSDNSFRLTFNGRRERRICGFYAGARVYSAPNALDDGLLHHVALEVEPGRSMTLHLDGKPVDTVAVPDRGLPANGDLAIGRRIVKGSVDDAWYADYNRWSHFRGRIEDVVLSQAPLDPASVTGPYLKELL